MVKKIAILHPFFNKTEADRILIDTEQCLQTAGYDATIWTCSCQEKSTFPEAKNLKIVVRGHALVGSGRGFLSGLFQHIAFLWLTLLSCFSKSDVYFVYRISMFIPIIKYFCPDAKVAFFSEDVSDTKNSLFAKLSEKGIKQSNRVYVSTAPKMTRFKQQYGAVQTKLINPIIDTDRTEERIPATFPLFVSLNAFEKKKNHVLAIAAFDRFLKRFPNAKLVIAGRFDIKNKDNVMCFQELKSVVEKLGIKQRVEFRKSIHDNEKFALFLSATAVLYTPEDDSFSVIPIEAQSFGAPVIACLTPGTRETCSCQGNFLCRATPDSFNDAMTKCYQQRPFDKKLRENAKKFGTDHFKQTILREFSAF